MYKRLLVTSIACLSALAALAAPSAYGAHDGETRSYDGENPSITQKMIMYDRLVKRLGKEPEVILLGSSKTLSMDPRFAARVSQRTFFNFGVSSANTFEAEIAIRFADQRTPRRMPHIIYALDVESFDKRGNSRMGFRWLDRLMGAHATHACFPPSACPHGPTVKNTASIVRDALALQKTNWMDRFHPGGDLRDDQYAQRALADGLTLQEQLHHNIAHWKQAMTDGDSEYDSLQRRPRLAFERGLAVANRHGIKPAVYLTPFHPQSIRTLGPHGWNKGHQQVVTYVRSLQKTYDFRLYDYSTIGSFEGTPSDWYDDQHMKPANANRLIEQLYEDGAFDRMPIETTRTVATLVSFMDMFNQQEAT